MKKTNKILLSILAPAAIISPILALVGCNCNPKTKSQDQESIDDINNAIKQSGIKFSTMFEMVNYIYLTKGIDLENLEAHNGDQYVWDIKNNVVFTMKSNETQSTVPTGYTMNPNKHEIWKMVQFGSTNGIQHDDFIEECKFGQYIVSEQEWPTEKGQLEFKTSIDVGYNEGYDLKYVKPTNIEYDPMVNTNKSTLEIEGTLGDINHYGNAKSLTITQIPDTHSYNEYGTVDGSIILKENGTYVGKPGSDVTEIIIEDDSASISLKKDEETEKYARVGSVSKTKTVTKEFDEIITKDESYTKEESPKEDTRPIDPEKTGRYAGGLGTIGNPYIIKTPDQLVHCYEDVSGEDATALSSSYTLHFALGADIDMQDQTFYPIGSKSKPFYGTFDGQDFTISNLTVTPRTEDSGYCGLFGVTKGTYNELYKIDLKAETPVDNLWDSENLRVKTENFDESKYSTVIKNITIDNIQISASTLSMVGGVVGKAENSYIYNCHVLTGNIACKSNSGGIVGGSSGSIINLCSTSTAELKKQGTGLAINGSQYNVGGIVGHSSRVYEGISNSARGSGILNCVNYSNVQCTGSTTSPNSGPSVSGIVGNTTNNNAKNYPSIVDNCSNYGDITANGIDGVEYAFTNPAGISSEAGGIYILSNVDNYGEIKNDDTHSSLYIAGIVCHATPIAYNCANYGKVHGKGDKVAGICADNYSNGEWTPQFIDIKNHTKSTDISTSKTGGIAREYFASQNTANLYLTGTFNNVDELSNQIAGSKTVVLKNVTVLDPSGTLILPEQLTSIISDNTSSNKVCSNIELGNATNIYIDIPGSNLVIDSDRSSQNVSIYSKDSNISVTSEGKIGNLISGGANSNVTNDGTIRTLGLYFQATNATNNSTATINNVHFFADGKDEESGIAEKTFINYGTVSSIDDHTLYAYSDVAVNPTIENYGTIKSNPTKSAVYLFLWYAPGTFTINNYEGSVVETTWPNGGIIAKNDTTVFNINYKADGQNPSKLIQNGTEITWESIAQYYQNVFVNKI